MVRSSAASYDSDTQRRLWELSEKLTGVAFPGVHGREPWKLHRGADAPKLLLDLVPGAASSSPRAFTRAGDDIFFAAADDAHGEELWVTPKEQTTAGNHPGAPPGAFQSFKMAMSHAAPAASSWGWKGTSPFRTRTYT
ncbi:hypothetical protein BO221_09270 [Archangium sp. Cb G35]|uniref:hypothetical protein n=1 Tax=Archangium sp. Cb G35 TaxID=1920190 RepID=UPI000963802D|nr:hypothetical protein [Archangium sp. Cb G35]OJT26014.1 hypothetical protein BO221_09270 [Archangium sp. Cb G35]